MGLDSYQKWCLIIGVAQAMADIFLLGVLLYLATRKDK